MPFFPSSLPVCSILTLVAAIFFPFSLSTRPIHVQLTNRITGTEVARHTHEDVCEGYFCGERRWCLQLRPSALDIDLIILTFIILEKRRLDKADGEVDSDEDPAEALCEGGTEMGCG